MSKTYPVISAAKERTNVDMQRYQEMYQQSVEDNTGFWSEQARRINWIKPFSKIKDVSWDRKNVHIKWFEDGTLNACFNCVDRHLETRADQTAIGVVALPDNRDMHISYRELHQRVCKMANSLKEIGAKR